MSLGSNTSTVGSDKLRKAIERNRAKQAKRDRGAARAASGAGAKRDVPSGWTLPGSRKKSVLSASKTQSANQVVPSTSSTRKSVARASDTQFVSEIRSSRRKAPAPVSYTIKKSKKSTRKKKSKINEWLIKAGWFFCFFLLLRLVFSERGIIDYYSSKEILNDNSKTIAMLKNETKSLGKEIQMIKYDQLYQKKLVRDMLGLIAKDEYLILFSRARR